MPYLVRKINHGRFQKIVQSTCIHDIEADIISGDLRTTSNCLSTWLIDDTKSLDNAILAIASTSKKVEKMSFLIIEESDIRSRNLDISDEKDDACPVADLKNTHRNISRLTYQRIGIVLEAFKNVPVSSVITRTRGEIQDILDSAIRAGRVDVLKLQKDVLKIMSPVDYVNFYGSK